LLTLPASVRIYVATEPTDLRRGFDGLAAATRSVILQNPMNGHLFSFLNRRRNRIKLLAWDRTGYLLLYRRLERGTFFLATEPRAGERHVELDAGELGLMLEETVERMPVPVGSRSSSCSTSRRSSASSAQASSRKAARSPAGSSVTRSKIRLMRWKCSGSMGHPSAAPG